MPSLGMLGMTKMVQSHNMYNAKVVIGMILHKTYCSEIRPHIDTNIIALVRIVEVIIPRFSLNYNLQISCDLDSHMPLISIL
jgi:hypothetical protein